MNILILGDGAWGTALGVHLHRLGHKITIWGAFPEYVKFLNTYHRNTKFLPGVKIPHEIEFVTTENLRHNDFSVVVIAIPVQHMRECLIRLQDELGNKKALYVCVAKGIETDTLKRPVEIVKDVFGNEFKIGGLYGPSHAEEVSQCIPTSLVATASDIEPAGEIRDVFKSSYLRIYINLDILGVELGTALKNVIAIAAGICDGLGFGDNTKAALITRGLVEMARLGNAMGAKIETFYGLSGLGDLVATAFSRHSRNREIGEKIGKGSKLEDALAGFEKVAEGIWTSRAAHSLGRQYHLDMPISTKVFEVLFGGVEPQAAVCNLMDREGKKETLW